MKRAYGRAQLILEILGLIFLAVMVAAIITWWGASPAHLPGHMTAQGETAAGEGRFRLLIMPLVGVAGYVLLTVLGLFVRRFRLPASMQGEGRATCDGLLRLAIAALKAELMGACCYATWYTLRLQSLPGPFLLIVVLVLLITMAAFIWAVYAACRAS